MCVCVWHTSSSTAPMPELLFAVPSSGHLPFLSSLSSLPFPCLSPVASVASQHLSQLSCAVALLSVLSASEASYFLPGSSFDPLWWLSLASFPANKTVHICNELVMGWSGGSFYSMLGDSTCVLAWARGEVAATPSGIPVYVWAGLRARLVRLRRRPRHAAGTWPGGRWGGALSCLLGLPFGLLPTLLLGPATLLLMLSFLILLLARVPRFIMPTISSFKKLCCNLIDTLLFSFFVPD